MPTSEGSRILLLLASLLAGIAAGMLLYVVPRLLGSRAVPATAVLDEAQRKVRRRRALEGSSTLGLPLAILSLLLPLLRRLPLGFLRDSLAERYAQAGWPGGLEDDEVLGLGLLLGTLVAIPAALALAFLQPLLAPAGVLLVIVGPGLVSASLARRAEARRREITRTMPYVLDLLVLTMRAGAAFSIAVERVSVDFARTAVGEEFRAFLADLERGTTMREALRNLSLRAPIPVVQSFTDELIQAEELGRPVAESLERLSERMRTLRVQEAVETAGRSKVLVLIPGMLVFVAVLLLLFAPFIVRYYYGGYQTG